LHFEFVSRQDFGSMHGTDMKTLFETSSVDEIKQRLAKLNPESQRLWGKMDAAQALAHCTAAFDFATGTKVAPRILLGRLFGSLAKRSVIHQQKPIPRNSMTAKEVIVADQRIFEVERGRLYETIDRFAAAGPSVCSKHPHFFFGPLKPEEWSSLMYQHLDHHLRQFGA
jgi:hypothetical protein